MQQRNPPKCTKCRKRPSACYDDATNRPICAVCWLKKYEKGT